MPQKKCSSETVPDLERYRNVPHERLRAASKTLVGTYGRDAGVTRRSHGDRSAQPSQPSAAAPAPAFKPQSCRGPRRWNVLRFRAVPFGIFKRSKAFQGQDGSGSCVCGGPLCASCDGS